MGAIRVGDLGEAKLNLWAAELGIVCNPAFQDRKGWDFLLEFPRQDGVSSHSLDSRPPEVSCLVQVKSSFSERMRRSLKLSNWEVAVKILLPFFYLCLHFDKSNNMLRKAYLVHVNDTWMEKVLKRLREETIKGNSDLSKSNMDLRWVEADKLEQLNSACFDETIRKHICGTMPEYIQRKSALLSNLGEPLAAEMNFSFSSPNRSRLNEDWIDLAIGVRDSIELDRVEIREDVRFDIPLATTKHEGGLLRVINRSQEGTDVTLSIRNNSLPLKSSFAGKLHTPHNFFAGTEIPEKQYKARVTFSVGEIIIRTYDRELSLNVNFATSPDVAPLSHYSEIWRLAHILHNSSVSGTTVSITLAGKPEVDFVLPPTPSDFLDPRYLHLAQAVDNACSVANYLGVPLSTSIPLDQILQQAILFQHVRAIYDPEIPISMIGGVINEEPNKEANTLAVALVKRVLFGDVSIFIEIGLSGPARYTTDPDGSHIFMVDQPSQEILDYHIDNGNDVSPEVLLDGCVDRLEAKGFDVIRLLDPIDKGFGEV